LHARNDDDDIIVQKKFGRAAIGGGARPPAPPLSAYAPVPVTHKPLAKPLNCSQPSFSG